MGRRRDNRPRASPPTTRRSASSPRPGARPRVSPPCWTGPARTCSCCSATATSPSASHRRRCSCGSRSCTSTAATSRRVRSMTASGTRSRRLPRRCTSRDRAGRDPRALDGRGTVARPCHRRSGARRIAGPRGGDATARSAGTRPSVVSRQASVRRAGLPSPDDGPGPRCSTRTSTRSSTPAAAWAPWFATAPGADLVAQSIMRGLHAFTPTHPDFRIVASLGAAYTPTVAAADVVIGNSSSGIVEVPTFGVPVVNVGDRQEGRERPTAVLDARTPDGVDAALTVALDPALLRSGNG